MIMETKNNNVDIVRIWDQVEVCHPDHKSATNSTCEGEVEPQGRIKNKKGKLCILKSKSKKISN